MLLTSKSAATLIAQRNSKDPLIITPEPDLEELSKSASASIDLRLGTWFRETRASRHHLLDIYDKQATKPTEQSLSKLQYISFGDKFILHPNSFVLAVTLEWIRFPYNIAGMVTGKSSWGRRGLIIETAPGVHPGYSGCLTLELTNVGSVPIALMPGTKICQIFLHNLDSSVIDESKSKFVGQRQPLLGSVELDEYAEKLAKYSGKNNLDEMGDLYQRDFGTI